MREQTSRNRPPRQGRSSNKKGRKNFDRSNGNVDNNANGNRARNPQTGPGAAAGVCIRCGHPAPDGKLCNFHRSLMNSIRNDVGQKLPRGPM